MKRLQMTVGTMVMGIWVAGIASAGLYDAWNYKAQVSFVGYSKSETLTNFPALVVLSNNCFSGFAYSQFQSGSNDLAFTDSTGLTNLNYEINTWNTNGASYVWVQVPALTNNATITAWWGNPGQSQLVCTTNGSTWTNGYAGVWHMNQTNALDSTTNRNNGTAGGGVNLVTGVAGSACSFDGTSGMITVADKSSLDFTTSALTIEAWVKLPVLMGSAEKAILRKENHLALEFLDQTDIRDLIRTSGTTGWNTGLDQSYTFATNTWYYRSFVYNGANEHHDVNGVVGAAKTVTGAISPSTSPLYFAYWSSGTYLQAVVEEIRISSVARSSNWVWACYQNSASNGVFNSYGAANNRNLPQITDVGSQNLSNISADVVGTLVTNGAAGQATVYRYWSTTDGTNNASSWMTGGGSVSNLGSSFAAGATFTNTLTGLAQNTTYYWNYSAVNASGTVWGVTTGSPSFKTFGPPVVNNGVGATGVGYFVATLNGTLTNGASARVRIYFGAQDGVWTVTNDFGTINEGSFSNAVSGLSPATTYYYTSYATNAYGSALAASSASFTTLTNHLYYVTPAGNGNNSGTNWANAFSSIQAALNVATNYGDTIYLQSGTWSNTASLIVSNNPGVWISGGYAGAGSPGLTNGLPTVLTRSAATSHRIVYGYASTVALARVTIGGGLQPNDGDQGGGLYLNNCAVTLQDCAIVSNVVSYDVADWSGNCYGGGLYATGGLLSAVNTRVSGNYVTTRNNSYGGGAYCAAVALALTNCTFEGNYVQENNGAVWGGGLYVNGGSASLTGCVLSNNWANKRYMYNTTPAGGGLWANNVNPLTLSGCNFTSNRIVGYNSQVSLSLSRQGSALYLSGSSLSASLSNCVFAQNGYTNDFAKDVAGSIWQTDGKAVLTIGSLTGGYGAGVVVAGGAMAATNWLVAGNASNGVSVAGGSFSAVNCTLANNAGWGLTNGAGTATVKDCIVWGNTLGGLLNATAATWSDVQGGGLSGTGNISLDPFFVSPSTGDYHEQSLGGSWHNGAWTKDAFQSPCIDAGDPSDARGALEPQPNFMSLLNMGAYGGTDQASKSQDAALPQISNVGLQNLSNTSVNVAGKLTSNGGATATVSLYWSMTDGTTNAALWTTGSGGSVSNLGSFADGTTFTNTVTGLAPDTTYYWNYSANNSTGTAWAAMYGSPSFKTFGPPGVNNGGGAGSIGPYSAALRGTLTNGVSASATVYCGTDPNNWTYTNALGTVTETQGVFSANQTGLARNTPYYYTIVVSNQYGTAQSPVTNFSTLPYVWITANMTCSENQTNQWTGVPVVVDGSSVVLTLSNSATYGNLPVYAFGNLIVTNGASVVCLSQGSMSPYTITNRGVAIQSAGDVIVAGGSSINADGTGFLAQTGPGGSSSDGGTYGGRCPNNAKATYGSATNPVCLGSGGNGANGGGAIKLIVTGNLMVNGRLSANGLDNGYGGGAGGSIWMTGGCTLGGTGEVQISGGNAASYIAYARGGGGGRLSIDDTVTDNFHGNLRGANGNQINCYGGAGSVYFGALASQSFTIFSNQTIVIGNDITNVFGNLTVYGTLVPAGSYAGQGAGVVIRADNLTITASGSISADSWGLCPGPGYLVGAGGTHAGVGQSNTTVATYGLATAPTSMGSSGGGSYGAVGGGAMKLIVAKQLNVMGSIGADGQSAGYSGGAGGSVWIDADTLVGNGSIHANGGSSVNPASGGGGRIAVYYHTASTFAGLPAPGLYTNLESISSSVTVKGGYNIGSNGPEDGSIYITHVVPMGTIVLFH